MTKSAAIIPASGIGDALIFEMAASTLRHLGFSVTTFSPHLKSFGSWLPNATSCPLTSLEELQSFDLILLQHDNSERSEQIRNLPQNVYSFFGSYKVEKHGPLRKLDFVFNPKATMVENLQKGLFHFFNASSKENGLKPPTHLVHRKHPKQIAIHPTSRLDEKNWPKEKFYALFSLLEKEGFSPVFTVSPEEQPHWKEAPLFNTLEELTSFLYESDGLIGNDSALGHIASYLNIPHLIIAQTKSHLRLWKPGWHPGFQITAPPFRFFEKRWKSYLLPKNVLKKFLICYSHANSRRPFL